MKITGTMRWALEQSLREVLENRGCKYGSAAYESVLDNSIALCDKTNGAQGIRESTILAALRIACTTIDHDRDKTTVTADEPTCPNCGLAHEMPTWVAEYHQFDCDCGWRFEGTRSKQIISRPLEYRE